jgi:hypothetical protein
MNDRGFVLSIGKYSETFDKTGKLGPISSHLNLLSIYVAGRSTAQRIVY